jgi:amino acid transporter
MVIALAIGPISLMALRMQLPEVERPFRLRGAGIWSRVAFVMATWSILWCGRTSVIWAVASILTPTALFLIPQWFRGRLLNLRNGLWWIVYLGGLIVILIVTEADGWYPLTIMEQRILTAIFALAVFPLAVASRLEKVSPEAEVEFRQSKA